MMKSATRRRTSTVSTVQGALKWIIEHTRESPCKKYVRTGPNGEQIACRWLMSSCTAVFAVFDEAHPGLMGQTTFEKQIPFYVRAPTLSDRMTCCCITCDTIKREYGAIGDMRRAVLAGKTEAVEEADRWPLEPFHQFTRTMRASRCDAKHARGEGEEHAERPESQPPGFESLKCATCLCTSCCDNGVPPGITFLPEEVNGTRTVRFEEFTTEVVQNSKAGGGNSKKTALRVVELTYAQLVERFRRDVAAWLAHDFRAQWSQKQINRAEDALQPGQLMIKMDFSMNLAITDDNEVQKAFFTNIGTTLLMMTTHEVGADGVRVKKVHCFFSDELAHSPAVVEAALDQLEAELCEGGTFSSRYDYLILVSDGCSGQFRSRFTTAHGRRRARRGGIPIYRLYYESGHGKGDIDGQSAIIKRDIYMECLRISAGAAAGTAITTCAAGRAQACADFVNACLRLPKASKCAAHAALEQLAMRIGYCITSEQIAVCALRIATDEVEHKAGGAGGGPPEVVGILSARAFRFHPDGSMACPNLTWVGEWRAAYAAAAKKSRAGGSTTRAPSAVVHAEHVVQRSREAAVRELPEGGGGAWVVVPVPESSDAAYGLVLVTSVKVVGKGQGRPPMIGRTKVQAMHGATLIKGRLYLVYGSDATADGVQFSQPRAAELWYNAAFALMVGVPLELSAVQGVYVLSREEHDGLLDAAACREPTDEEAA
ncbi:hypothetical protein FOA52_010143 [Chlamydomonas sp. UWO 241]|nr:hypothetical protein FOA52_010143 [Chlamydomonas sp. UWO 241]